MKKPLEWEKWNLVEAIFDDFCVNRQKISGGTLRNLVEGIFGDFREKQNGEKISCGTLWNIVEAIFGDFC